MKRALRLGFVIAAGLAAWIAVSRYQAATGQRMWILASTAHATVLANPAQAAPEQADAAVRDLEAVVRARPGTVWAAQAVEAIGLLHFGRGEYEQAREAFNRLVWSYHQFRDMTQMALIHIGRSYERESRWDEAAAAYDEIAWHHPWTDIWMGAPLYPVDMHERRGDTGKERAVYERAAGTYRKRIAEAPTAMWGVKARGYLAHVYRRLGKDAEAARVLEELSEVHRQAQRSDVLLALARTYRHQLDDPQTARRCYLQILRDFSDDPYIDAVRQEFSTMDSPSSIIPSRLLRA